jgi:hypothetical protein
VGSIPAGGVHINPFNRLKIMCLGYGEDFEQFTEFVLEDDKQASIMVCIGVQVWVKGTDGINPRTGKRRSITRAFYART